MASLNQPTPVDGPKRLPEIATELWELTVAYAKQETIDPIKGLGRFVGAGVGGAIFLGVGVSLLLLAGLRALQTETSTTFTGNWSWAPYLIVLAAGLVLIALAVLRVSRRKGPGA
ncbi:MAG: phage holin family protein [Acidimicrobiales bacterium]|nr:phage holin family protein [Acidimicrobiales bacterium]